ncbi:MAG: GDP-mannose 4,6-dehydratase [Patescibacteria group bacterium]
MNNFWSNKRVLVTGGWGFVGSHLAKRLIDLGAEVFILEKSSFGPAAILNKESLSRVKGIIIGDISEGQFVLDVFKNQNFEICFHLAAQPLVERGNQSPLLTFEVNIIGTVNILEAVRQGKLGGLVLASTTHVYGENKLPLMEEYSPKPLGPYETSKICAEMLAQTYAKHYGLPITIARFVNIYGPGDQNERIIPRTIKLLLKNQSPEVFNPRIVRDYLFIEDAIDGYLVLGEKIRGLAKQTFNIVYNFGTGKHYSAKALIEKIITLMDKTKIVPIMVDKPREQEVSSQYVSIEKAKTVLGWQPRYSLEKGLKKTIDWYAEQANIG